MFCRKCNALLEGGRPFCPRCFTAVERRSMVRRAFDRLIDWCGSFFHASDESEPIESRVLRTNVTINTSSRIKIHDRNTGEMREYSSIEEVPVEYRDMLESMSDSAGSAATGTTHSISIRGNDGIERVYSSLDEVPADMRPVIEQLMRS